ncbi:hypothetical protein DDR33_05560 [Pararcticibacter amylolyticus]|uniref:Uncharacterized protein n=1 Tax=Pararcticibacter amylolyticus TaxID=2173175 RepID=A0A2U2PK89_9SPHI|nr:hypothetical protein DDR33_05560 [Pararcticibacter amylolyticus]
MYKNKAIPKRRPSTYKHPEARLAKIKKKRNTPSRNDQHINVYLLNKQIGPSPPSFFTDSKSPRKFTKGIVTVIYIFGE